MNPLGRSWKTTLTGVLMLIGISAKVGNELLTAQPVDWTQALTIVATGVGLIMAKDHNVGGLLK